MSLQDLIILQDKCEELEKKLEVAVEALIMISKIGYYHDYGDHREVASTALAEIETKEGEE